MSVSVRLARLSDAADVARLTGQLGYDVETSALRARLAKILERPDQRVFVADVESRPVGWLHAAIWEYIETGPFVIVGGLVVDRAHRRRGIGGILMRHAEEWAREQGCSIVRLWSSSTRTAAHEFYARQGYTNVKTQYSFAKSVAPARPVDLSTFVPRVE